MAKLRCEYERDLFERGEFEVMPGHGLVHVHNLEAGAPAHTLDGRELGADDWEGTGRAGEDRQG